MTIESGKDGQTGLMIQCISCKWWREPDPAREDGYRICDNPKLRAMGYNHLASTVVLTSPIFACNQSEAK